MLASDRRERFIRSAGQKGLQFSGTPGIDCVLPRTSCNAACFPFTVHIPSKTFGVFPPRVIDGGVTILSRLPILETEHILFSDATPVKHCVRQVA